MHLLLLTSYPLSAPLICFWKKSTTLEHALRCTASIANDRSLSSFSNTKKLFYLVNSGWMRVKCRHVIEVVMKSMHCIWAWRTVKSELGRQQDSPWAAHCSTGHRFYLICLVGTLLLAEECRREQIKHLQSPLTASSMSQSRSYILLSRPLKSQPNTTSL